jgi:hypothetical protein
VFEFAPLQAVDRHGPSRAVIGQLADHESHDLRLSGRARKEGGPRSVEIHDQAHGTVLQTSLWVVAVDDYRLIPLPGRTEFLLVRGHPKPAT